MHRLVVLIYLAVAVGVAVPSTGFAQSEQPSFDSLSEAQKRELASLVEAGRAAYDAGNFDKSLRYFQDAYAIYSHPDLLYRIGLSYERLGEDAEAVRYYRKFLQRVPDAPERGRIERTIRVLEERLAEQASKIRIITDPKGAVVFLGDEATRPSAYTDPYAELPVSPGNYKVIVKKEGFETIEEQVDVPAGQTVIVRYPMVAVDAEQDSGGIGGVPTGSLVLGGVGVVASAFTIYSYGAYTDAEDKIAQWDRELKGQQGARPEGYDSTYDDMTFYQTATYVGAATAVACFGGAIYWWLASDDGEGSQGAAAAITPMMGEGVGGASVWGRW